MKTKYKPNFDAQMKEHEMPEYKGKWMNYHLWSGGGQSFPGVLIYDTKEQAAAQADVWLKKCLEQVQDKPHKRINMCLSKAGIKDMRGFLATIQIPVGGQQ